MFIIECAIRGSAEMSQIHTQWWHFLRLWVFVDFDDVSLERCGQLIIYSLSCSSLSLIQGVCSDVPNLWHFLTVMGYCWFWWYVIRKILPVDRIIIVMFNNGYMLWGHLQKTGKLWCNNDTENYIFLSLMIYDCFWSILHFLLAY